MNDIKLKITCRSIPSSERHTRPKDDFNKVCEIKRLSQGAPAAKSRHTASHKEIRIELNTAGPIPVPNTSSASRSSLQKESAGCAVLSPARKESSEVAEKEKEDENLIVVAEEEPENEADISFQQTSPQIQFPSSLRPRHGHHLKGEDLCIEESDPIEITEPEPINPKNEVELECSSLELMKLRDNEDGPFDPSEPGTIVRPRACDQEMEESNARLRRKVQELEDENRALRAENLAMGRLAQQVEARSQKIVGNLSKLEDLAKKASEEFKLDLEKSEKQVVLSKRTIESVDSQSGYADEGTNAGKMVLLEGIVQSIEKINSIATESCHDPEEKASPTLGSRKKEIRQVSTLKHKVKHERQKVGEYAEFLRSIMDNLSQIAEECGESDEDRSKFES